MSPKSKSATTAGVNIGAHVGGGLQGAVAHAREIGAQAIQIFIGSPQTWRQPTPEPQHRTTFMQAVAEHALGPVFVHGNYLVNLASPTRENQAKSVQNLSAALRLADSVSAQGLIFHPGSALTASYEEALKRVIAALEQVLSGYSGRCKLLLEVCAGQGQTIGDQFVEFRDIFSAFAWDKRLGVCWDTCHLLNAGYDIASESGLERTIEEFERQVGFKWLYAIHANDSKHPLGSRKDRHENIGEGYIGRQGFQRLLHHRQLRNYPWILEVPGFEKKGPDRQNIEIMHWLAR